MKIAYYMPFKPMGHKIPSGDLIIGTELFRFLEKKGEEIALISRFRCRWIYLKPHLWPVLLFEIVRILIACKKSRPEVWLSYHCYYKAPDVIGPLCCRILNIPYVIFQGIYSTKRKRSALTWPGFYLNRLALCRAAFVFTNKRPDEENLRRLLPDSRVIFIPPGLHPGEFRFDPHWREQLRRKWGVQDKTVLLAAAMFRPGVKTQGIRQVIESCARLKEKNRDLLLVIAGDGTNRKILQEKAENELGEACIFLGKVTRGEMVRYYSAADIFVFPGINESLGMVYLEAQSCGLPVVACADWGASQAVVHNETGLLAYTKDEGSFDVFLERLIIDKAFRQRLGRQAADHVRRNHDILKNYALVQEKLRQFVKRTIR